MNLFNSILNRNLVILKRFNYYNQINPQSFSILSSSSSYKSNQFNNCKLLLFNKQFSSNQQQSDKSKLVNKNLNTDDNRSNGENFEFYQKAKESRKRQKDVAIYGFTVILLALAFTYGSVPLYRLYCQSTGKGGKAYISDDFLANKVKKMKKNKDKLINVIFLADKEAKMRWNFMPTQDEIKVYPGETALAFFTAKNPTNQPVNGVSTYSVAPVEAGQYLNKIQCFCFEEQRLDPGEEVDMPVFFYFDPEYASDPRLENVDSVALSYTFFEAKEGTGYSFFQPVNEQELKKLKEAIAK